MNDSIPLGCNAAQDHVRHLNDARFLGRHWFKRSDAIRLGPIFIVCARTNGTAHGTDVFRVISFIETNVDGSFRTIEARETVQTQLIVHTINARIAILTFRCLVGVAVELCHDDMKGCMSISRKLKAVFDQFLIRSLLSATTIGRPVKLSSHSSASRDVVYVRFDFGYPAASHGEPAGDHVVLFLTASVAIEAHCWQFIERCYKSHA